jgi:hypothetical protein
VSDRPPIQWPTANRNVLTSKHMLSAGRSLEGLLRWERR